MSYLRQGEEVLKDKPLGTKINPIYIEKQHTEKLSKKQSVIKPIDITSSRALRYSCKEM